MYRNTVVKAASANILPEAPKTILAAHKSERKKITFIRCFNFDNLWFHGLGLVASSHWQFNCLSCVNATASFLVVRNTLRFLIYPEGRKCCRTNTALWEQVFRLESIFGLICSKRKRWRFSLGLQWCHRWIAWDKCPLQTQEHLSWFHNRRRLLQTYRLKKTQQKICLVKKNKNCCMNAGFWLASLCHLLYFCSWNCFLWNNKIESKLYLCIGI